MLAEELSSAPVSFNLDIAVSVNDDTAISADVDVDADADVLSSPPECIGATPSNS